MDRLLRILLRVGPSFLWHVAADGIVFLANRYDGLRAYTYDGTSFANRGHIHDGEAALALAVASDGTIFLANGYDDLRVYTYDGPPSPIPRISMKAVMRRR